MRDAIPKIMPSEEKGGCKNASCVKAKGTKTVIVFESKVFQNKTSHCKTQYFYASILHNYDYGIRSFAIACQNIIK